MVRVQVPQPIKKESLGTVVTKDLIQKHHNNTMKTEVPPLFLSEEKIKEIQSELDAIENQILPSLRKRLADAYEDGDLPENNPWITANTELSEVQQRRNILRFHLARAKAAKKLPKSRARFSVGSEVTISLNGATPQKITLVESEEADPLTGKVSVDSPIGRAILDSFGQKTLTVKMDTRTIKIDIL